MKHYGMNYLRDVIISGVIFGALIALGASYGFIAASMGVLLICRLDTFMRSAAKQEKTQ